MCHRSVLRAGLLACFVAGCRCSERRRAAQRLRDVVDRAPFDGDDAQDVGAEGERRGGASQAPRRALRPVRQTVVDREDVARQAGADRRAREAAVGCHVAIARRDVGRRDQATRCLSGGLHAAAASEPSRGRDAVPEVAHRPGEGAGRARPRALRSRFPDAGASARGESGGDLPDDAARSRRRVQGPARDADELLRAVQRHPESEAARRTAPAADAVPAAAVQRDRRPAFGASRARASRASIVTPTATRTAPRTSWATFARRNSVIASRRPRCAA